MTKLSESQELCLISVAKAKSSDDLSNYRITTVISLYNKDLIYWNAMSPDGGWLLSPKGQKMYKEINR